MSTLFIGLKNIDDDKKLSGKVYFEDSDAFEPLAFGKDHTEYWISFENKSEMDDDELDAVRDAISEIKEIVPSAAAAYCSDESEGTGQYAAMAEGTISLISDTASRTASSSSSSISGLFSKEIQYSVRSLPNTSGSNASESSK